MAYILKMCYFNEGILEDQGRVNLVFKIIQEMLRVVTIAMIYSTLASL